MRHLFLRCSAVTALLVAVVCAWGCEGPVAVPGAAFSEEGAYLPAPAGSGVVADPQPLIPDVPSPIGFKPVPSRCTSSFDGTARQVKHVYQGRADDAEVIMMYRRTLPRHGWQDLGREQLQDGSTVLRYNKGPEALRIQVGEKWGVATVLVEIAPKSLVNQAGL